MTSPGNPRVSFRLAPDQMEPLEARAEEGGVAGSVSEVAKRDLERYYRTLSDELRRAPLEEAEWNLLRDALNGYLHSAGIPANAALLASAEDSIQLDGAAKKWGTDGDALLAKLRAMSPAQALAVIDAVERWWLEQG